MLPKRVLPICYQPNLGQGLTAGDQPFSIQRLSLGPKPVGISFAYCQSAGQVVAEVTSASTLPFLQREFHRGPSGHLGYCTSRLSRVLSAIDNHGVHPSSARNRGCAIRPTSGNHKSIRGSLLRLL